MQAFGQQRSRRAAGSIVRLGAGLAVLAMVVAACGDDPASLSKEDFVAQADAICAATNEIAEPIWDEFWETAFADLPDGPTTPAENAQVMLALDALFDDLTPLNQDQLSDLRALGLPDGDGELITAIYDDFDDTLAAVNQTIDDAVAGDSEAIETLTVGDDDPFADVNQRARDYGLVVCGAEDE